MTLYFKIYKKKYKWDWNIIFYTINMTSEYGYLKIREKKLIFSIIILSLLFLIYILYRSFELKSTSNSPDLYTRINKALS